MSAAASGQFYIKTDSDWYWSNQLTTIFLTNYQTLKLTDKKTNLFEIDTLQNGGVCIKSIPGNYLMWSIQGEYALLSPSTISSTTDWNNVPQEKKKSLTFTYLSQEKGKKFMLQPSGDSTRYFKRVQGSAGTQYVVGINQQDSFGLFQKIFE